MESSTRRSRWSVDGGSAVEIYASDIDALAVLDPARYRYLTAKYIAALTGRNHRALTNRFKQLKRRPNCWVRVPEQIRHPASNFTPLVYELAPAGAEVLRGHGRFDHDTEVGGEQRLFAHQLMIDTTFASIEYGISQDLDARFMLPKEILGRETFPLASRQTKRPFSIPVEIEHTYRSSQRTHRAKFEYTHDGIRGIEFTAEGKRAYRYIQIEAEHKNRVDCSNLQQASFLKKFLAVQQIMHRHLYRERWGIGNLMTLVLTPHQERINTMKSLILRETEGKGASYILFRVVPMFGGVLEPDPSFYAGAWQRAGHSDFYLNRLRQE